MNFKPLKNTITKSKIKSLIEEFGIIETIRILELKYGDDMNSIISDDDIKLMVWQFTHSLKNLETILNIKIKDFNELKDISKHYNSLANKYQNDVRMVISNQLINSTDSIKKYVDL